MNDIKKGEESVFEAKCPQCSELMASMGRDFESPKKDDIKKWEHLKTLYSVGIAFHSCGCSGGGYIPNSKEKLIEYFEELRESYFKNLDFWRNRTIPSTKKEIDKENQRSWYELSSVSSNYKKEAVENQEGIKYWLERVKEVEAKISLVK
ncbi:hypothetical protein ACFSJW_23635 [Flavobacterium artemisiae]|uniref:Uncharacterized protein n=1 Tax=Flavobacterium artemisiae TaxID=2126556 RepID=A0ABW4H7L1_9FLAO